MGEQNVCIQGVIGQPVFEGMLAICVSNGIDRHEGRLARLNRTVGRTFEEALRGSDGQPRLTRILTAPKSRL
jgi:hypothetical protein